MPNWTKADIDGLVERIPPCQTVLRRALYLAAGLTAEGARKPERVPAQLFIDEVGSPNYRVRNGTWDGRTFVPARPPLPGEPKPAPKPETVECWMSLDRYGCYDALYLREPQGSREFIPGTFVPD